MYHYTEYGLPNIWLANGYQTIETDYGPATKIDRVEALHKSIALTMIRDRPHLTGSEFRFLRTELDLSQARLASYFGYNEQAIALWEKKGKVPKWADRFLRALYRETAEGHARLQEIIDRLNEMDRQDFARQEFEERNGTWMPLAA